MDRTEQQQQIENLSESQSLEQQPTAQEADAVKGGIIIIGGTTAITDGTSNTVQASPQLLRPAWFQRA